MKDSLWQSVDVLIPSKSFIRHTRDSLFSRHDDKNLNIYDRTFGSYKNMIEEFLNCSLFTRKKGNPDFWLEEVITYNKCVFPVTFGA